MLILALETTGDVCSVAVRDAGGPLVERLFRHRMHLSERLLDDVGAVLADAGTTLAAIDALGVGLGPGSFTGVRIGVTTVKTWADVLGKPVCGVSALAALAEEYAGVPQLLAPIIRSRPGTLYSQRYGSAGAGTHPLTDPEVLTVEGLVECLSVEAVDRGCVLFGPGLPASQDALASALATSGVEAFFGRAEGPRASAVAAIAERRLAAGRADDPLALVPLYIAPPPIDPRVEEQVRLRQAVKRGGP